MQAAPPPPGSGSLGRAALRWAAAPLSGVYAACMTLRNRYYDCQPGAVHKADVPVVSVGNLTVGGTGKTPLVIELVRRLRSFGRRPAILTRGYRQSAGQEADEVLEFRDALPTTPVVVDADRVAGAARAIESCRADCLVMDDGFQHRRLARELDIVLLDALDPWGAGWVLPAGRLREPRSGLARAGLIIITRANQAAAESLRELELELEAICPDTPRIAAHVVPCDVLDIRGASVGLEALSFDAVLPVCGLGNPRTFVGLAAEVCGRLCGPLVFTDHAHYTPQDVQRIAARATTADADCVLTTRKDWVKLAPLWKAADPTPTVPLLRLDVQVRLVDPGDRLTERLESALARGRDDGKDVGALHCEFELLGEPAGARTVP